MGIISDLNWTSLISTPLGAGLFVFGIVNNEWKYILGGIFISFIGAIILYIPIILEREQEKDNDSSSQT